MPGHVSKGTEPSCPSWQHPRIRFDWEGRKSLGTNPGQEEGDAAIWATPPLTVRKGQQAVTGPRGSPPSVILAKLLARSRARPSSQRPCAPCGWQT